MATLEELKREFGLVLELHTAAHAMEATAHRLILLTAGIVQLTGARLDEVKVEYEKAMATLSGLSDFPHKPNSGDGNGQ